MDTCQIQWIDSDGKLTPDDKPAVAIIEAIGYRNPIYDYRPIPLNERQRFFCCADHLKRIPPDLGSEGWRILEDIRANTRE
jgi:hypothetical protein